MRFAGIKNLDELIRIAEEEEPIPASSYGLTYEDLDYDDGKYQNDYDLEFADHFNILENTAEGYGRVTKYYPATRWSPAEGGELEDMEGYVEATTYMSKESFTNLRMTYDGIEDYIKQQGLAILDFGDDLYDIKHLIAKSISDSAGMGSDGINEVNDMIDLQFNIKEQGLKPIQHEDGEVKPYVFFRIEFYTN